MTYSDWLIFWWFKQLGNGSNDDVESLIRNVNVLCVDNKQLKRSKVADWLPPAADVLKFNVDGSSRGKPGPSGIGGVLRDMYGKVICLFSSFIGVLDSNVAELMAIKKAVELCWATPTLRGRDIFVVSDSKVAVAWVNKGDFGNVEHLQMVYDIRSILLEAENIKVIFDLRIFNSFADSLAKMGSSNQGDFVEWGDLGSWFRCVGGFVFLGAVIRGLAVFACFFCACAQSKSRDRGCFSALVAGF